MNLGIEYKREVGNDVLYLNGEVDAFTASNLKSRLLELSEKEKNTVVIDLSRVSYMDSTGIGVIIAGYKSIKSNESELYVRGLTSRVKRLFDITGLSEIVEVQNLEGERT